MFSVIIQMAFPKEVFDAPADLVPVLELGTNIGLTTQGLTLEKIMIEF